MKLTALLLTLALLQVSASTRAQQISMKRKQITLQELFKEIRKQTGYNVLWKSDQLDASAVVPANFSHTPLDEVMKVCLQGRNMEFIIDEQTIVVRKKTINTREEPFDQLVLQEGSIKGTVTDAAGLGVPGVSVLLEGAMRRGGTTNKDGVYNFSNLPLGAYTLSFSAIGYAKKTRQLTLTAAQPEATYNESLTEEVNALNDVVVIGYGVQRKSDLTGSVGSVSGETLHERPASTVNQVLGGRIAGANVTSNTGRPGGRTSVRIRGNTSISITSNPLYVIDGVILNVGDLANGSNPIDFINPNDIASVEVLKDASATAIYGARGANGVILITTKRGNKEGGQVNYSGDMSVGTLAREQPLLNAAQFLQVEDIAYQNAAKYDPAGWAAGKYQDPKLKRTDPRLFDAAGNPLYDTDWQKEATRNALSQNHQLSLTGGNEKDNYGIFLGYRNENGVVMSSFLKRFSGRFVMDSQLKSWLKVGGSLSYNDQKENQVDVLGAGNIHAMRQLIEELPIIPVHYPDGSYGGNVDYPGMEGGPSPVDIMENRTFYVRTQNLLGDLYTDISLAKGLSLRTTLGVNIIGQETDLYSSKNLYRVSLNQGGIATVTNRRDRSWQFENYLNYNRKMGEGDFTGLLGLSWQHVDNFNVAANAQNFADDYYQYNNLGAGATLIAPASGAYAYGLNSYFGRANYNLKNKYLFTVTARMDGSSKFGEDNRYAFFPSGAFAWRLSDEEFIKNIQAISNLKLRTSYGVTGNSEITTYQALAGLSNYSVNFNGQRATGVGLGILANPDLKWEKTQQLDAGLEIGLWNNRLALEVDVYRKLTNDMLLNEPLPTSSGFSNIFRNVGSMVNRGIEFALTTTNISTESFNWKTTFNLSINKNEVKSLAGGGDIFPGTGQIVRVGYPVGSFYGYINDGTWSTSEEAEAAKYLKRPGDIKYRDLNNDGVINTLDQTIIGKGIPDGYGTFLNTFSYKNFDLTLDLQFMYGNDILNVSALTGEDRQGIANSFATVLDAWTPDHQDTHIAQLRPITAGYDSKLDSYKVKNGSFIRGRNLLLAYRFSPDVTQRLHLNRLRVFASMENFFLITQYKGYDPEVSTSGQSFAQGIVNNDYPRARTFRLGLDVTF